MYYRDLNSNLGWVIVPKNASSTMSLLTQKDGWVRTKINDIQDDVKLFGVIQNPWKRYLKGIAELAWINNERSFTQVRKTPFFKMAFLNPHIMPISLQYPTIVDRIHWLPLDSPRPFDDLLNEFLEENGSNLRITPDAHKHVSSSKKLAYQIEVKNWMTEHYPYKRHVIDLHQKDFELWQNALLPKLPDPQLPEPQIVESNWLQRFLKRIWTSE